MNQKTATHTPEFTPGPWGIETSEYTMWIGQLRPDGLKVDTIVASCDGGSSDGYKAHVHRNKLADAQLIAAAPELLEALKSLIARAEAMGWEHSIYYQANREAFEKARAAIARATKATP